MTSQTTISMNSIVCVSLKNGIGKSGRLPWKLQKDMKYFKFITSFIPSSRSNGNQNQNQDHESLNDVVMTARRTWESIPKRFIPLESRIKIIISKNQTYESLELSRESKTIYLTNSIQNACKLIKTVKACKTFLFGGSELYNQIIQNLIMIDSYEFKTILITRVLNDEGFECDRFLNEFRDKANWKMSD
ncbi:dihydrofolate reductase-like domain-containing protein [Melampsora americana]|nr:dihydrofolate reductase-like domain-containing protein [Melampsora americana]